MLAAAVEIARAEGLAAVTFRRVARSIGTNDRTVVYYFPSKTDLLAEVLVAFGQQLQTLLEEAFGDEPLAPDDLLRRSWPVLNRPQERPLFAVFFEVIGQAAVGRAPYDHLAPLLLDGWLQWLEPRVAISDPARRRACSLALLAQLDGLLLLRSVAGDDAAGQAAQALGIAP